MPLKCRSCGHLNRDKTETCERCGCDLQYSLLFDTVIRNRKEESPFLFPLDVPDGDEVDLIPEMDEELDTEEHFHSSKQNAESKASSTLPGRSASPVSKAVLYSVSR